MNKLELEKTMEVFGLSKADSYEVNGCKYYHDGRYFTIVEGRTPYDLAMLLQAKYDNDKYKIRVDGLNESLVPTYDVYTYHIDTIEGLVAFLLERQDYFSKTEEASKNMEDVLKSIYSEILEALNPRISIDEWMLDRDNRQDYFKTILNEKTYADFKIRKKLQEFDGLINPFSTIDIDFSESDFIVSGYIDKDYNCCCLIDKDSGIRMRTTKDKNSFVTRLYIPADHPYEINVYHYFDENGEEIAFERYDETGITRMEYNLTNNTFGEHYGEKHQTTSADKKYVLENLTEYNQMMHEIVRKNLGLDPAGKKIIKNKDN